MECHPHPCNSLLPLFHCCFFQNPHKALGDGLKLFCALQLHRAEQAAWNCPSSWREQEVLTKVWLVPVITKVGKRMANIFTQDCIAFTLHTLTCCASATPPNTHSLSSLSSHHLIVPTTDTKRSSENWNKHFPQRIQNSTSLNEAHRDSARSRRLLKHVGRISCQNKEYTASINYPQFNAKHLLVSADSRLVPRPYGIGWELNVNVLYRMLCRYKCCPLPLSKNRLLTHLAFKRKYDPEYSSSWS